MSAHHVKRIFFDTNILFYAHDKDAGVKHERAADLVLRAWEFEWEPVISIQVLQELAVNLQRKNVSLTETRSVVEDYSLWRVIENDLDLFQRGMTLIEERSVSLWDAMIVAAALQAKAQELWTEDLNTGEKIDYLHIVNPLSPKE